MNLGGVDAFAQQILVAIGRWRKQQIGKLVGQQAIDFFGHGAIARAQSGLDVTDGNSELGTDQRRGDRRVHVAIDEDEIGLALEQDGLECQHDGGGLLGVGAGTDFQVVVGLRHFQLLEKYVRHGGVVVLPGVDQSLPHSGMRRQRAQDGSGFHEIRPGADDVKNVHMNRQGQSEIVSVSRKGTVRLSGLGGDQRCVLLGQRDDVRGVSEGAVKGVGERSGKCRRQQVDVELQIARRVQTVHGEGAAAPVGGTQQIQSNGPDGRVPSRALGLPGLFQRKSVASAARLIRLEQKRSPGEASSFKSKLSKSLLPKAADQNSAAPDRSRARP